METKTAKKLGAFISPSGAWAFALGTSIGWGSLVITANTYLSKAGPMGSVIGMIIGGLIMLVISRNYAYMMNSYPEAGGAYAFSRETFGYDHGFLTAWFLMLTYLAILWANATAFPLFARYFIGDIFHFGYLYTIFGYDVYVGELLLTTAALFLAALVCTRSKKLTVKLMVILAGFFALGITVCFLGGMIRHDHSFEPLFVPDSSKIMQTLRIAVISPWAFIGFENISHFTEEFSFSRKKSFRILTTAVVVTTLLYIFVMVLSVTAYPPEYNSWLEYIRDLGNLSGIEGLPAFYAARYYLGSFGITVLIITLLALLVTSLLGNIFALSRLFYAMAADGILPKRIAELDQNDNPSNAVWLIFLISLLIPFLGRTAIGWIVDVTTLGATLIYAYVSAAALKLAKEQKDKLEQWTGLIGLVIMIAFVLYLLLPNLITTGSMETASYFLFVIWAVLGFIFFRGILKRDDSKRFGKSIIVWIALLSLILFVSLVWMSQSTMEATTEAMNEVQNYYIGKGFTQDQSGIIADELNIIRRTNARSILVVIALFATSLGVLLNNYALMSRRATESETQLAMVSMVAYTDPLTGVKSKHAYSEKEKSVDAEIDSGNSEAFAIAVCDVNGLKIVNDTYGHKAGDAYIREASHMICELFAHSPVYRTGGDEFVIYLNGRDYENRAELMETLHQRSVENIAAKQVVVSGGMSEFIPGRDHLIHEVFERADKLMYQEKQALKKLGAPSR